MANFKGIFTAQLTPFDKNDKINDAALEKLIKHNIPFEINTGAIARGYKKTPYPSFELTKYIAKLGGKFILSSDSHNKNSLCSGFDKWEKEYGEIGADIITANF